MQQHNGVTLSHVHVCHLAAKDTPPLLLVPDAIVAAKFADAVLLVTEFGRTDTRELEELSRRLAQTGRPIHGVIATKVGSNDPAAGVYTGYS